MKNYNINYIKLINIFWIYFYMFFIIFNIFYKL